MKLRSGDSVVIISGKDKGKTGTVLRVLHAKNRLVVSGINMRKRHLPATPQRAGSIVEYEAGIAASNVMLLDPKTKKRTRIAMKVNDKGHKARVALRSGEALPDRKAGAKTGTKVEGAKTGAKGKSTKKSEDKETTVVSAPPAKGPFWKKVLSFGEDVKDQAEVREPSHMKTDKSVPDQTREPSTFTHGRGD